MGLLCSLPVSTPTVCRTHPFSVVRPQFHQGPSPGEGSSGFGAERSRRARSFAFSGLLQPAFCGDESLRVVETGYRFVYPQSESPQDSLQDGDPPVCASVCAERRLDGIHRLEGRFLANSNTSGQPQVPQICGLESSPSIQGSLFRPRHGSAGFHTGHGSGIGFFPLSRDSPLSLLRRLADSSFSSLSYSSFGHGFTSVSGTRDCGQLGEIQSSSSPEGSLSRCNYRLHSFQGFSLPSESREAVLNHRRISVLQRSASLFLARTPQSNVVFDSACSRGEVKDAISAALASPSLRSQVRFAVNSLGLGLPSRSGMVVGSGSSPTRYFSDLSQSTPRLLVRCLGRGLGSSPPGQHRFRLVVSGGSHSVYKCKGASCGGKRTSTIRTSGVQFHSGTFLRQLHSPSVSA